MFKQRKLVSIIVMLAMVLTTISVRQLTSPMVASAANTFEDYTQEKMVNAMGAGWNLGNQLEASSNGSVGETNFGNPVVTEDLILAVKEEGFKSVRIPVSYLNTIGAAPNYTVDSKWLDRIQEVVDMCVNNGLYAIINIHGDGYNSVAKSWLLCNGSDQAAIKAKYEAVWKQIATRFADYDEHLVFESMNEEFDGTYGTPNRTYYSNINAYNQIFVDTVRKSSGNNDKRWLLIPGWNTNIDYTAGDYGFELPTDNYLSSTCVGKRIMISVHYYDPWDFCGTESTAVTQWGPEAKDSSKVASWGDETYMNSQMKKMYDKFVANGYPVVIGEYGAIDKTQGDSTNNTYRAYFCESLCKYAKQYGMVPVYWDNGYNGNYGFGLFDRSTKKVTQQGIIDAIMTYYGDSKTNTSTAIKLDQSAMSIYVGDEKKTISATLTPADSQDKITWTSSDETVATVNAKGQVTAVSIGTATITATANGHSASCKVTVPQNQSIRAKLYMMETKNWQSLSSTGYVEISKAGGQFSLSLTGTQAQFENIGSLYIKDIASTDGSASVFDYAKLKVKSIEVNSVTFTCKEDTFVYDCTATDSKVGTLKSSFDFSFINVWDTTYVNNMTVDNGNYKAYFNGVSLTDNNTLTVNFEVSDVEGGSDTPATTAPATQAPTVAPTSAPATQAPTTAPTTAPVTQAPTATPTTAPATSSPSGNTVQAEVTMTSDWGEGGLGQIVFTNTTGKDLVGGWTLEFDMDREIGSTWSANIVSHTGNHYVITNPSWNGNLASGDSYTIDFQAKSGAANPVISNAKLY
ncbi:MAG: cellulase family glycosylhydrolase [bacterium]|nr:cellulase family glycosylhydrolase [bacterium]